MKIIPAAVWTIAILLGIAFVACMAWYRVITLDWDSGFPLVLIVGSFLFLTFAAYILMVGYIYSDAKRRGMRPVLWVLLAVFIPNAIGILLYFILREPLLLTCPKCGAGAKPAFPFCPACGESLGQTCPSCRSLIESGWSHCAKCGAQLARA
jgi:hypothetical protein